MSKDTHDQNQGLDTPDTTPSVFRIIMYAILGYAVVACATYTFLYGFDISDRAEQVEQSALLSQQQLVNVFPPSAYFTDPFNPDLLPEQVQQANLRQVESPAELGDLLGTNPEITIILVDEAIFRDESNVAILQHQLSVGKMIVGLRTPLSELGDKLGRSTSASDLERGQVVNAQIWVSMLREFETNDQDFSLDLTEAYQQIPQMMTRIHELVNNGVNQ